MFTGLYEIHCCGELPKLLHHSTGAEHFSSSWAVGSDFSGAASPQGCLRKMPSHLCSSATSPQQHLAFYSQLRNPLVPLLFSLNLELELTGRHNFLCPTLCCLPDVLLHVNIHSSEGNIALIKSWKSSSPVHCSQQGQHWAAQGLVQPKYQGWRSHSLSG